MPHDREQDLSELTSWLETVGPDVGVDPDEIPVGDILDLATAVARGVLRPGVPVTAFLAGLAVGRGLPPEAVLAGLSDRAREWRSTPQQ